jgi:hypothetical protein
MAVNRSDNSFVLGPFIDNFQGRSASWPIWVKDRGNFTILTLASAEIQAAKKKNEPAFNPGFEGSN